MPLLLRDMESITTLCEEGQSGALDSEAVGTTLNNVTLQVQFLTILLSASFGLRRFPFTPFKYPVF